MNKANQIGKNLHAALWRAMKENEALAGKRAIKPFTAAYVLCYVKAAFAFDGGLLPDFDYSDHKGPSDRQLKKICDGILPQRLYQLVENVQVVFGDEYGISKLTEKVSYTPCYYAEADIYLDFGPDVDQARFLPPASNLFLFLTGELERLESEEEKREKLLTGERERLESEEKKKAKQELIKEAKQELIKEAKQELIKEQTDKITNQQGAKIEKTKIEKSSIKSPQNSKKASKTTSISSFNQTKTRKNWPTKEEIEKERIILAKIKASRERSENKNQKELQSEDSDHVKSIREKAEEQAKILEKRIEKYRNTEKIKSEIHTTNDKNMDDISLTDEEQKKVERLILMHPPSSEIWSKFNSLISEDQLAYENFSYKLKQALIKSTNEAEELLASLETQLEKEKELERQRLEKEKAPFASLKLNQALEQIRINNPTKEQEFQAYIHDVGEEEAEKYIDQTLASVSPSSTSISHYEFKKQFILLKNKIEELFPRAHFVFEQEGNQIHMQIYYGTFGLLDKDKVIIIGSNYISDFYHALCAPRKKPLLIENVYEIAKLYSPEKMLK